ncbi:MAG TPA: SMP-30/gluconolactonase/LRE family protein [Victivallales bacterium]|nr:SMP-30/gluconolactonase/LRE family protein [Victivallales bacterium]
MKIYNSKKLLDGLVFPESPRWNQNKLWFTDIYSNRIFSANPNGKTESEYNLPAIGFDWLPDGSLVYIERSLEHNRIMKYSDGNLEIYCDLKSLSPFQFNDMTIDSHGNIYTGSTGNKMDNLNQIDKTKTAPLVLKPYNKHPVVVAENLNFPNGIAISHDNKKLIVAETFTGKLTEFTINFDGTLSNRQIFAQLDNIYTPDGLFIDLDGAVWVGAGINCCIRVKKGGEITHKINTIGHRCNACSMDNKGTIYLCTRGKKNPDPIDLSHKSGMIEVVTDNFISNAGCP